MPSAASFESFGYLYKQLSAPSCDACQRHQSPSPFGCGMSGEMGAHLQNSCGPTKSDDRRIAFGRCGRPNTCPTVAPGVRIDVEAKVRPMLQLWSTFGEVGPHMVEFCRIGPTLANSAPNLAAINRTLGQPEPGHRCENLDCRWVCWAFAALATCSASLGWLSGLVQCRRTTPSRTQRTSLRTASTPQLLQRLTTRASINWRCLQTWPTCRRIATRLPGFASSVEFMG